MLKRRTLVAGASALAVLPLPAYAQKKYDRGASDTEIKLGHTNPYSGPLSAYGVIGLAIKAYWAMVNDKGGVNGRKINFITYDDAITRPKRWRWCASWSRTTRCWRSTSCSARRPTPPCTST